MTDIPFKVLPYSQRFCDKYLKLWFMDLGGPSISGKCVISTPGSPWAYLLSGINMHCVWSYLSEAGYILKTFLVFPYISALVFL